MSYHQGLFRQEMTQPEQHNPCLFVMLPLTQASYTGVFQQETKQGFDHCKLLLQVTGATRAPGEGPLTSRDCIDLVQQIYLCRWCCGFLHPPLPLLTPQLLLLFKVWIHSFLNVPWHPGSGAQLLQRGHPMKLKTIPSTGRKEWPKDRFLIPPGVP